MDLGLGRWAQAPDDPPQSWYPYFAFAFSSQGRIRHRLTAESINKLVDIYEIRDKRN